MTKFYEPTSVEEAVRVLAEHGAAAQLVAGGTDVVVNLNSGAAEPPDVLVSVKRIAALRDLSVGDQGGAEPEELDKLLEPIDGFPDLENERGRGFFLIKAMVDELVVVKSRDGRGLEFRTSRNYVTGS